jgi:hypothetical protein
VWLTVDRHDVSQTVSDELLERGEIRGVDFFWLHFPINAHWHSLDVTRAHP